MWLSSQVFILCAGVTLTIFDRLFLPVHHNVLPQCIVVCSEIPVFISTLPLFVSYGQGKFVTIISAHRTIIQLNSTQFNIALFTPAEQSHTADTDTCNKKDGKN